MIDEPNEALKGECEPVGAPCGDWEPPPIELNGSDGDIENVEPPKLKAGADWLGNRLCDPYWLALNA